MRYSTRRPAGVLLVLTLLLLALTPGENPRPASAQSGSSQLTSTPGAVDLTLALGSSSQVSVTIGNSGSAAISPQIFESLASGTTTQLQTTLPAELASVPLPEQEQRIDPLLSAELADAPEEPVRFLVFLGDQADLSAAYSMSDWSARGWYVYRALHDHAEQSQQALRSLLTARGLSYQPLWIVNAIVVDGDAADVAALAGRAEVAMLRAERVNTIEEPVIDEVSLDQVSGCLPNSNNVCWNIVQVGADRVWSDFGVRGEGITVASIDSGVNYTHPALAAQYRGYNGGSFNHNYNWYDPYGNSPTPVDSYTHGTHTMGTMVAAGSSASSPAVGMAPRASWITARGCGQVSCSESSLLEAAEWMLAPTDLSGASPRPDKRPQVINSSWSASSGNVDSYMGFTTAWRASGIFPVFSIGNTGFNYTCGTALSPGDYANVVGVGAVDKSDLLSYFSRIGPTSDGRLKPDITAPGSAVVSTVVTGSTRYLAYSGTSMSAPHVAGAVALIWSANPSLIGNYDATYQILTSSAHKITADSRYASTTYAACQPTVYPNNIYGYGRLDAYAAVAQARVDVPWLTLPSGALSQINPGSTTTIELTIDARRVPGPGAYQAHVLVHSGDLSLAPLVIPVTLTVPEDASYATVSGVVSRSADGLPLKATVAIEGGAQVTTDSGGQYSITLPPSSTAYSISASAFGHTTQTRSVLLGTGERVVRNFQLDADLPVLNADQTPVSAEVGFRQSADLTLSASNTGTQALSYSMSLAPSSYGVWRSDQPDGPLSSWINPPANAITLSLTHNSFSQALPIGFNFPYFERNYSQLYIGANGLITFSSPLSLGVYIDSCMPVPETTEAAIVPLRIELDPIDQTARLSYANTGDGFLVTWENMPSVSDPTQRMSFQALLRPDGRVSFNYAQLGALAEVDKPSFGLQGSVLNAQGLGCGADLPLSGGLSIELRPQADGVFWIALPQASGLILAGQQASLPVHVRWVDQRMSWPLSAEVLISSNDPLHPEARLSVRMIPGEAPYSMFNPMVR